MHYPNSILRKRITAGSLQQHTHRNFYGKTGQIQALVLYVLVHSTPAQNNHYPKTYANILKLLFTISPYMYHQTTYYLHMSVFKLHVNRITLIIFNYLFWSWWYLENSSKKCTVSNSLYSSHPFLNIPTSCIALQLLDSWVVCICSYYEQYLKYSYTCLLGHGFKSFIRVYTWESLSKPNSFPKWLYPTVQVFPLLSITSNNCSFLIFPSLMENGEANSPSLF